jgi:hypothetical protein
MDCKNRTGFKATEAEKYNLPIIDDHGYMEIYSTRILIMFHFVMQRTKNPDCIWDETNVVALLSWHGLA